MVRAVGGGGMGGAGGAVELGLLGYAVMLSAVPLMMPLLTEEEVEEADWMARYVVRGDAEGEEGVAADEGEEDAWGRRTPPGYASLGPEEDRLFAGDDVGASWGDEDGPLASGEGLKWALMAILSVMPGLNWAPWALAAVDADRARDRYALYAGLYVAPWLLSSGLGVSSGLSWVAFATVLVGVAHVQVERAAVFRRGGALGLRAAQARLPAALEFALRGARRAGLGSELKDGLWGAQGVARGLVEREGRRARLEEVRAGAERDAARAALEGREEVEERLREQRAFDRRLLGGRPEGEEDGGRARRRGGGGWLDD